QQQHVQLFGAVHSALIHSGSHTGVQNPTLQVQLLGAVHSALQVQLFGAIHSALVHSGSHTGIQIVSLSDFFVRFYQHLLNPFGKVWAKTGAKRNKVLSVILNNMCVHLCRNNVKEKLSQLRQYHYNSLLRKHFNNVCLTPVIMWGTPGGVSSWILIPNSSYRSSVILDFSSLVLWNVRIQTASDEQFPQPSYLTDSENTLPRQLSPDVLSALQGVRFIAQHIKDADKDNECRYCGKKITSHIWTP
ncbi:hypothetical protein L9F63_018756, partial [Diploptera punctata]